MPQLQNMSHEFWSNALASHPDKEFVKLILDRVNFGVNIGFNGSSHQVISRNWKSVQSFRPHVLEFINTNLSKNRIKVPWLLCLQIIGVLHWEPLKNLDRIK